MAIPINRNICLPLLKVINDNGGEFSTRQAISAVEIHYPDLTVQDKQVMQTSGGDTVWSNNVQWARLHLIHSNYLDTKAPRGIWRITEEGRSYLKTNWHEWKPRYSTKKTDKVEPLSNETDEKKFSLHEQLKQLLCDIGRILKYYPESEFRELPHIYDVVWKNYFGAPRPHMVFEIQDKGSIVSALAKLQHAKDAWGSSLFLVITGESDRKKVEKLVGPYLSGTFHRLARDLVIFSAEQVEELFHSLNRNRDMLKILIEE